MSQLIVWTCDKVKQIKLTKLLVWTWVPQSYISTQFPKEFHFENKVISSDQPSHDTIGVPQFIEEVKKLFGDDI